MLKNRKKILLIAPIPPPFGGVAFIAKSLLDAGLNNKFNVIHLNTSIGKLTENYGKITSQSVIHSIYNLFKLMKICFKNRDADGALILGTNGPSISRMALQIFILKVFRIKVITNLHGTRHYPKLEGILKKLNNYVINSSFLILSPTKIDYRGLQSSIFGQGKQKLFYNSTYIPEKYLTQLSSHNNTELLIVGTGRFSKAKGAYDLLDICINLLKANYKIKLNWIGRGAFESDDKYVDNVLFNLETTYKDKLIINRDISDEQKYQILAESDVFILPSYTDNLPISIIEAMAFGLPIISTNIGEIPDVVRENINGWIVEPGDSESIKNRIIHLIKNIDNFDGIREKNKQDFLEKYSVNQRIAELIEYI